MKILHVDTGKEWRGGQRQVYFLHNGLTERGIESYLAANAKGELIKKVQNAFSYDFRGEVSLRSIFDLKNIIKKVDPDIVHAHDAHALTPAVILKYLGFKFKLIYTKRTSFDLRKNFFNNLKYGKVIDKIVVISKTIEKSIVSSFIEKNRVKTIYSGVVKINPDDYKCQFELNNDNVILGCVAKLTREKDIMTLLRAFDTVFEKHKNILLLIVGDGDCIKELERFASNLKSKEKIIFAGFQENVYDYYKCFDIFVITSKEEGLCTSVLDAFQFGLPVVSTNAGGLKEIVKDNFNGFLCNVGDYICLADKIKILIESKGLYERFSVNAKQFVSEFYVDKMIDQYVKLYREIL